MQLKGYYLDSVAYSVGDIVLFQEDNHVYHLIRAAKKGTKPHDTLFWGLVDQKLEESVLCVMAASNTGRKAGTTIGENSVALGKNAEASGQYSIAAGNGAKASAKGAVALGTCDATDDYAFAQGSGCKATGLCSTAFGASTSANGGYSLAVGNTATADGETSQAFGTGTTTKHKSQLVFGEFNALDNKTGAGNTKGYYAEIVGNGTSKNARSNARTLDWDGNEWLAGSVEPVGGLILKSSTASSTKRFMITVDDDGELTATEIVAT